MLRCCATRVQPMQCGIGRVKAVLQLGAHSADRVGDRGQCAVRSAWVRLAERLMPNDRNDGLLGWTDLNHSGRMALRLARVHRVR